MCEIKTFTELHKYNIVHVCVRYLALITNALWVWPATSDYYSSYIVWFCGFVVRCSSGDLKTSSSFSRKSNLQSSSLRKWFVTLNEII